VRREDEIDLQLAALGLRSSDLRYVLLTHLHGGHINGLARLAGTRVLASAEALHRGGSRALARRGCTAEPLSLAAEPFGAFTRWLRLTQDQSVVALPVPGHVRGQIAVTIVDGHRHIVFGADSAFNHQQLLDLRPAGVSFSARTAIRSMRTILEHARLHGLAPPPLGRAGLWQASTKGQAIVALSRRRSRQPKNVL
jgi:N-acyl homoserine lactone hydrolase